MARAAIPDSEKAAIASNLLGPTLNIATALFVIRRVVENSRMG